MVAILQTRQWQVSLVGCTTVGSGVCDFIDEGILNAQSLVVGNAGVPTSQVHPPCLDNSATPILINPSTLNKLLVKLDLKVILARNLRNAAVSKIQ